MIKIHVGCAGWDYKDWIRVFYPKRLDKSSYLGFYSKFFNIVEVNSTFYNLPSDETVFKWYERVPISFKFIIKAWQNITHDPFNLEIRTKIIHAYTSI